MVLRSRLHVVRLQPADGATGSINFNLNPGSRLQHVSVAVGVSTPPLRVSVVLRQPRESVGGTLFLSFIGGWVRGPSSNPAASGNLEWTGDVEIDTDMALRFVARNDTGSAQDVSATFMVFE